MLKYNDRQLLEKKLIEDFKEEFYKKIGYYPVITTRIHIKDDDSLQIMSLEELETYFIECFPKLNIKQKERYRELVDLRSIFSYFARAMRYKLVTIGRFLGNRDHTTILHYVTLFNNQMDTNPAYREQYKLIYNHIKKQTNKNESSTLDYPNQTWLEPESALFS